ncbi:MAG: fibronectin type III domain-containing protein [Bdellovibrionaceae bacterium]|nr:fibronectin type III domain-containing protein [Pseudobdellovibrionaceae bacterium]
MRTRAASIWITRLFLSFSALLSAGCLNEAQTLSPEPSLLEQDDVVPTCPGLQPILVSAGPTLTLAWGQSADNLTQASAITYKIYMRQDSASYDLVSPAKVVVGATTTSVSNGISVGHTYTLFVTCSDEKGNTYPTSPTNEQSIAVSDILPPSQITNLSAGSATYTSILLTWSPSDDGAGGTTAGAMRYKVYASTTTPVVASGAPLATVGSGGTSYLHSGLSPATVWYYKVVAMDLSNNEAAASNEATTTTLTDVQVPTFSGNTSATIVTSTTTAAIGLSWTAATDDVTAPSGLRYRVYRCAGLTTCDPYAGSLITTTNAGVTTFTDTGLSASTVYVYGIRAMDSSNNVSVNTDKKITSTSYSAAGSFYAYPSIEEVNIRFGLSVAVGNVVGDATGVNAFPDLLVGAPNASEAGSALRFTGCVFVFEGTAVGTFSSTATSAFCQPNPIGSGTQNGLNFGTAIAIGNMDGDAYDDVIVSNPVRANVYIYRTQNTGGILSVGTTANAIPHPGGNTTFGTGICVGNSDNVGADDLFIATTSENCDVACGGITGTGNLLVFNNISTPGTVIIPSTLSYRISPTHSLQAALYNIQVDEVVVRSCTVGNFDAALPAQTQLVDRQWYG